MERSLRVVKNRGGNFRWYGATVQTGDWYGYDDQLRPVYFHEEDTFKENDIQNNIKIKCNESESRFEVYTLVSFGGQYWTSWGNSYSLFDNIPEMFRTELFEYAFLNICAWERIKRIIPPRAKTPDKFWFYNASTIQKINEELGWLEKAEYREKGMEIEERIDACLYSLELNEWEEGKQYGYNTKTKRYYIIH